MANLLPLLITRGIIVFPHTSQTIEIGRPKSIKAVRAVLDADPKNNKILIASQIRSSVDDPQPDHIYKNGVVATIKLVENSTNDDSLKVEVTSLSRVRLTNIFEEDGYTKANYVKTLTVNAEDAEIESKITKLSKIITSQKGALDSIAEIGALLPESLKPEEFLDRISNSQQIALNKKQLLIEEVDLLKRFDIVISELSKDSSAKTNDQREQIKVNTEIDKKVSDSLNKQQREFYLRERLRAIKEELGELNSKDTEIDQLREKFAGLNLNEVVRKKVNDELSRYESTPPASQESNVIKNYLDWMSEIPWSKASEDNKDLNKVKTVLDANHFGLEKIKERIVEFLAIKIKANTLRGPIICLVGPPGVGKTSFAKSIAESLGRKFVKVSLGGVRDEAEIRGHRRTYLGSMPGRIIQGMKKAGVVNPLFLLDEIDKMSSDHRGDPSSALLEVLDPEQNKQFSDNYIEEEYDLSKVMFVATANYYGNIPAPLIDRMEIIELSSYTAIEKLEIAKSHLVKKVLTENGVDAAEISFSDEAIAHIISYYTREAGVRELERLLAKITRKFAVKNQVDQLKSIHIDISKVREFLGKEIYDITLKDENEIPGVVNGMAFTSVGGDLLPIEVTLFPGKGKIEVTGNLKETMKESANVALAFVRANATKFKINSDIFKEKDIHIHVPQGGVPKDGPSAGVALTTAILSAVKGVSVPTKISMTGEITLRGKVLIIGGVKEKVISAHRAGVRTIFLPKSDERYLEDIPQEVLKDIKVILVEHYDEIYSEIFYDNVDTTNITATPKVAV